MKNWNVQLPQIPRWIRLCIWGALAGTLTVCIAYNLIRFTSFWLWLVDSGEIGTAAVVALLHAGGVVVAGSLWLEFYRTWKRGVSL